MTTDTLEFLKWAIGLPAAIVAVATMPLVIRKYLLECRKLLLEIELLKRQVGVVDLRRPEQPGKLFVWFARYWVIPCYGSLVIFSGAGLFFHSSALAGIGFGLSLLFFVWGSATAEHYQSIQSRK